mmetsp:Transcript_5058/g.10208  ORF Transcript_5058/g.10208 Transcript_5058/m.10208 type:complete len:91 (-) Transcript_5058:24-296(-)
MPIYPDDIEYEYRHVILPKAVTKEMWKLTSCKRLLEEAEWQSLGVSVSCGWKHYEIHRPEPHILLFRRRFGTDPHRPTAEGGSGKAVALQ